MTTASVRVTREGSYAIILTSSVYASIGQARNARLQQATADGGANTTG